MVSSLPASYTGLPFNLELGLGETLYKWEAELLPDFVELDAVRGILRGRSAETGAWPIALRVTNRAGRRMHRQLILNVVDSARAQLWAGSARNYYDRQVESDRAFRVLTSHNPRDTLVYVGKPFNYRFLTANAIGSPVFAFNSLPDTLSGDVHLGTVAGTFGVAGIYTIGVESADQEGSTAEGFVTITVLDGAEVEVSGVSQLSKVTVSNKVDFVYDLAALRSQQVEADKELFAALAVVNVAKSELAAKQGVFDNINVQLTAAEAGADKAASNAANANSERERAAFRVRATNKALNNAEDKLNLALLEEAGALSNVKKAEKLLEEAQVKFDEAQKALNAAEENLQEAQAELNQRKLEHTQAATNLKNARKDFKRANEDLNDAKQKVNNAEENLRRAEDELTKARDELALAKQAYAQAERQLEIAKVQLAKAFSARQAALEVLQHSSADHEKAASALGAAEWNLAQATAALNVANAAKEAADRTSALVIANGVAKAPEINLVAEFNYCRVVNFPSFLGAIQVVRAYADRALLATGNTILFGSCTEGHHLIREGVTLTIKGVVNPDNDTIEVSHVEEAKME